MTVSAADFRSVLGRWTTGVTVITTLRDGRPEGLTASSFSSLSLDPPLVLFCLDRAASTFDALTGTDCFAVNILAEDQSALSNRFASPEADRFAGLAWTQWETGAPILPGCVASLDCRREALHDGGDHVILTGRVLKLAVRSETASPLVYFRGSYRSLASV